MHITKQSLLIYSNPKYLLFEKVVLFADEKYNQACISEHSQESGNENSTAREALNALFCR